MLRVSIQHGGLRVIELFAPRASVSANKVETTCPFRTFLQKLYSVPSAIYIATTLFIFKGRERRPHLSVRGVLKDGRSCCKTIAGWKLCHMRSPGIQVGLAGGEGTVGYAICITWLSISGFKVTAPVVDLSQSGKERVETKPFLIKMWFRTYTTSAGIPLANSWPYCYA